MPTKPLRSHNTNTHENLGEFARSDEVPLWRARRSLELIELIDANAKGNQRSRSPYPGHHRTLVRIARALQLVRCWNSSIIDFVATIATIAYQRVCLDK